MDEIRITVSCVISLTDGFSGGAVKGGVSVKMQNGARALKKPGGYYVFVNVPRGRCTVEIESAYYQHKAIEMTADGSCRVMQVSLMPSRNYPFREDAARIYGSIERGCTAAAVLDADSVQYRIQRPAAKGSREISILAVRGSINDGARLYIADGKKYGIYVLSKKEGTKTEYTLDKPLSFDIGAGSSALPVFDITGSDEGAYFLAVKGNAKKAIFVYGRKKYEFNIESKEEKIDLCDLFKK